MDIHHCLIFDIWRFTLSFSINTLCLENHSTIKRETLIYIFWIEGQTNWYSIVSVETIASIKIIIWVLLLFKMHIVDETTERRKLNLQANFDVYFYCSSLILSRYHKISLDTMIFVKLSNKIIITVGDLKNQILIRSIHSCSIYKIIITKYHLI